MMKKRENSSFSFYSIISQKKKNLCGQVTENLSHHLTLLFMRTIMNKTLKKIFLFVYILVQFFELFSIIFAKSCNKKRTEIL